MKFLVLSAFLALVMCGKNNPVGPVINSTPVNYGDTLLASLRYQRVPDTAVSTWPVLEITLVLQNTSGRPLVLDSTWNNTYINVTQESTQRLIWASPPTLQPDTAIYRKAVAQNDSCLYKDIWRRLDHVTPWPQGRYVISGAILGMRTNELVFDQN